MKRILAAAVSILIFCSTALADKIVLHPSGPVNVSTFIELFVYRSMKYSDGEYTVNRASGSYSVNTQSGIFNMNCTAGSLSVDTNTGCIKTWSDVFIESGADESGIIPRIALAISCLQVSAQQDSLFYADSSYTYEYPLSYGLSIISDYVFPKMQEENTKIQLYYGQSVLVFSGVYNYYLSYRTVGDGFRYILTAKAK